MACSVEDRWAILLALGLLAASVVLDVAKDALGMSFRAQGLLEDGAKLLGIAGWTHVLTRRAFRALAARRAGSRGDHAKV